MSATPSQRKGTWRLNGAGERKPTPKYLDRGRELIEHPGLYVFANHDPALWLAWQFDVPEKGEGMVQAFRRDKSAIESARFPLAGLDAEAPYVVTNLDSGEARTLTRP